MLEVLMTPVPLGSVILVALSLAALVTAEVLKINRDYRRATGEFTAWLKSPDGERLFRTE